MIQLIRLCALSAVISSSVANAGLKDAFNAHTSSPATTINSKYMQGTIGASFHARNANLYDRQLFNMKLPSVSGSCSGIDAFAGSFSMVTKDEIVQMARGIAQGAPGYFFQLSIDAICPNCGANIKDFLKKLQSWNQLGQNSCQKFWDAASKTDVVQSYQKGLKNIGETVIPEFQFLSGAIDDYGEFMSERADQQTGAFYKNVSPVEAELIAQNTVLELVDDDNFDYNDSLGINLTPTELYMSFFGWSIVNIDNTTSDPTPDIDTRMGTVDLRTFIYGPEAGAAQAINLTQCKDATVDPKCLDPDITTQSWNGLVTYYRDFIFNAADTGILQLMNRKQDLTTEQIKFISTYRYPYLDYAKNCNFGAAEFVADYMATNIAFTALSQFLNDISSEIATNINSNKIGPEHLIKPKQVENQMRFKKMEFDDLKDDADERNKMAQQDLQFQLALSRTMNPCKA